MARLILLADDSPTVQRRAQGILQGEGFEVETVSNGVAAIKKLPKMEPVLVLADVSMPGKDGYEVCDYVKTSADLHHVPVLLVASDLEPYDEQRGAKVGADGIIKKPFAPHELIAMVAKFVALGEARAIPLVLAETPATLSPAAPPEVSPMVSEPDGAAGGHEPQLAAPAAAMAFAGPPEPLPDFPLQPSPQPPLPVREQSLPEPLLAPPPDNQPEGSSEPLPAMAEPFPGLALEGTPEPTASAPEPTSEPAPEAAREPLLGSPESVAETAVEPSPEPTASAPEPTSEPVPEAAREPLLGSPESVAETAGEPSPEPTVSVPEPTPEPVPEAAPESVLVSPESVAETAGEPSPEPTVSVPEPTPEPVPEAAPEPLLVSPESVAETAGEPSPEPTVSVPEPTPEPVSEAAPEPLLVSPESVAETPLEVASEVASVEPELPLAEPDLPSAPVSVTENASSACGGCARGAPVCRY